MTLFALEERQVLGLVASVRPVSGSDPESTDPGSATELFARMAWTVIAEPGDQDAGLVVDSLGAAGSLRLLLAGADADGMAGALTDAGAVEPPRDLELSLRRWAQRLSARSVMLGIEQAARFGVTIVTPADPDWPAGLGDLGHGAPIALWLRGRRSALAELGRAVAIVGARAATGYGEHVATELAVGVADRDVAVVSGGAYGIDGVAHRGALAAEGLTVAALAGGLDRFYPAGNERLFERILERGLLLAEVPPGVPPTKIRFLTRNRLLAAMSRAVVVVEAGLRSGSLNTAGHAAQIGRPIGAVPGPVTSPTSAGCHRLLREFPSTCITSAEDVMALLGEDEPGEAAFERPDERTVRVLDELRPRAGREASEIARRSGLAESEVLAVLGPLELAGRVRRAARGWTTA